MFYLPRICEHCLNPSCMASCPSGAIYKRVEDGIVLVDQDKCRGWRQCVTGCPYKKIYFNHKTGKAEKMHLLLPAGGSGAADGVLGDLRGRLRYLGLFLYDADAVTAAAAVTDPAGTLRRPDGRAAGPERPRGAGRCPRPGHPGGLDRRGPALAVYALAKVYKVALPLHPEYRTMPMVWYVPPLSPVVDLLRDQGTTARTPATSSARSTRCASRGVPRRALHRGGRGPGHRGAEEARGHALLHARHQPRQRPRRHHPPKPWAWTARPCTRCTG